MNKFNRLLKAAVIAAAAVLTAGCTDEPATSSSEVKTVTFNIAPMQERESDGISTKITLSDDLMQLLWQAADSVGIYPNSGSQIFFTIDSENAGQSTVSFDGGGWAMKRGSIYQAYYPFIKDYDLKRDNITVTFASLTQNGNGNRAHLNKGIYMYTEPSSSEGSNLTFTFKNLCAFIEPKVTLPAGTYVALKVSAEEPVFTAEGYFNMTESEPEIVATKTAKSLTLRMNNITFAEQTQLVAYIAAAPAAVKGKVLTFTVFDDKGNQYSYDYTSKYDLDATYTNVYTAASAFTDPEQPTGDGQLNDIDIEAFDWSEPGNDDWTKAKYPNDESDLSKDATANCYAALPEHSYSFKATVKGNSSESLDGTPVKAEVLWESFGSSTAPNVEDVVKNVAFSEGSVSFTTVNEGNAVIAVKDSNDEILWSWHIWVTSADLGGSCQLYYGGNVMMDRNLGALSATPGDYKALGLLYQWGRKDPFLGSSSIGSNTKAVATVSEPSPVESTESTGTIDYATKHPTTFITYNSSNYDWYYTGDSNTDDTRWNANKGIYDPCPPGWRVPDGGEDGVWAKARFSEYATTWNETTRGMIFGDKANFPNCKPSAWFPAAGGRYDGDGYLDNVGNFGYCWSCTPNGYFAYILLFYGGLVYPQYSSSNRALGFSVRCQAE